MCRAGAANKAAPNVFALLTILCLASAWARELTNIVWAFSCPSWTGPMLAQLLLSLLRFGSFFFSRQLVHKCNERLGDQLQIPAINSGGDSTFQPVNPSSIGSFASNNAAIFLCRDKAMPWFWISSVSSAIDNLSF